jgi:nitrogen fixation NifU-like protein
MPLYSKEIIKYFKNPKNMGKIKNSSACGIAGNLTCGDVMKLYLKIEKNKKNEEIIKDIKFETMGCAVAIANTSLLTTMVKGKTIKEALKIKNKDLIKKLGQPLPAIKIHCSILAVDALHDAINNYFKKTSKKI